MSASGPGRPGAASENFLNQALIQNEHSRAWAAKNPKLVILNEALIENEQIRARAGKSPIFILKYRFKQQWMCFYRAQSGPIVFNSVLYVFFCFDVFQYVLIRRHTAQ